ncbi:MAG: hypothetical protein IPK19_38535 [Chloroflexi bacterium]|nr:hypothetical protein [Chloroflexota bacterium]
MNDQLSGQLVLDWAIPKYAQEMFWLESPSGAVQTEGVQGLFTLPEPADSLVLRWGGAEGPALARLAWRVDSLEWDGTVRLGGYIDAMHIAPAGEVDGAIVVLHLGGQPLKPGAAPYVGGAQRKSLPYQTPGFFEGIDDDTAESFSTWLAVDDSPVLALAQDALVSKLRVWCFGRLTAEKARWHERFALPLWLGEMTLFNV